MFKQASLGIKFSLAFLLIAALVAGVGFYEVRSVNHLNTLFVDLANEDLNRKNILSKTENLTVQMENSVLRYRMQTDQSKNLESEKAELAAIHEDLQQNIGDYRTLLAATTTAIVDTKVVDQLDKDVNALYSSAVTLIEADMTNTDEASQRYQELVDVRKDLSRDVAKISTAEAQHLSSENSEVNRYFSELNTTVLLLVGSVLAFSVTLGLLISRALSRSLKRLRRGAARIANGDFSQQIPAMGDDEVGQLAQTLNDMASRLRDSYNRLAVETVRDKTLLESLGEGVVAIDENAKIDLINDKAINLLELPEQEKLIGVPVNSILTLVGDNDKRLADTEMPPLLALQTQKPIAEVYGHPRQAGGKMQLAVTANPVVVNEKVAGAIMTLRDVTKEKEVDRMKTEFISLASHQLRTPLSAIKWFTEMLVSGDAGDLKPDQLEFAKNISDSTERMIALVNALLNISRIESGRIMVDPKPTDLHELVSGIVNDLRAKTEEKQQTLIISVHDDLPKINLDPRLIGQVYMNLLTNAIKYTPKGGEISVFISKKDDQVISQVTDNGYGIPKEQQGRIFQKFFRAANAVKVETDGTGLGLYLIKSVVESSGGKIWFESEEGKGTTFWFSIPLSGMQKKEGEVTLDV